LKTISVMAPVIISLVVGGTLPATAGTLSVPMLYQQQNQWCWAASCQMILSYYGTSSTQCSMANWCFGQSTCCNNVIWPNGTGSSCNQANWIFGQSGDMEDVLIAWGAIYGTGSYAALPWVIFQSEIDAGHPFVIGFSWYGGGGHALVGRGYSGSSGYYNDPWPGNGPTLSLYSWMVYAPGDHTWDQSYRLTTNPPGSSSCRVLAGGDYNGDTYDDIAIFRPAAGLWSVRGITRVYFGSSLDLPVPGDYNGNATTDIGIFRPTSGLWKIKGVTRIYFGSSSHVPVPGDYNGDGTTDVGIFRPSTGLWAFNYYQCYFGTSSDVLVPGDYNGDGTCEPGIFRVSSGLWAIRGVTRLYFGGSGDTPVPGWFIGTYHYTPGIFRASAGLWAIRGVTRCYFGSSSDQPVLADYDNYYGDDLAIFRQSSGLWAIRGGNRYYFGANGDIPVTR